MSDELLEDVKQKRNSMVYNKMERAFRVATSSDSFAMALGRLFEEYGVPIDFEFERDTESVEVYANAKMRRQLKFYYDVETTKYPKGFYYLSVDIVSEGDGLAVSGLYFNKTL